MCLQVAGATAGTCATPPAGATTYSYDPNGNRTASSDGGAYTYNARNQATSIKPNSNFGAEAQTYAGEGQGELTGSGSLAIQNNLLGVGVIEGDQWGRADVVREPSGRLFSTSSTASGATNSRTHWGR